MYHDSILLHNPVASFKIVGVNKYKAQKELDEHPKR
jgi:hypothetical protein